MKHFLPFFRPPFSQSLFATSSAVISVLTAFSVPASAQQEQDSSRIQTLDTVKVSDKAAESLPPSIAAERKRLERTPGGVNLALPQLEIGKRYTLRDALDYQPGIVLQDFFGGADQPVLNIRGSGIQSQPLSRGVMLLENGLPLNEADGSFVIGMLEPRDARMIAARRGANAVNAASDALGGELDFYNLTAADERVGLMAQYGSFNTGIVRGALGRQFENGDVHLSVSGSMSDGYRDHSDQHRSAFRANFGLWSGERFENRTWLSYTDQRFQIPGPLTRDAVFNDPESVTSNTMPMVPVTDPHRDTRQWRIANRSLWRGNGWRQTLGLYYQNTDDLFMGPLTRQKSDTDTMGAQYQFSGESRWIDYGFGASWAHSSMDRGFSGNPNNPTPAIRNMPTADYDAKAENFNLQATAAWKFAPGWSLDGLLRWTHARRDLNENRTGSQQEQSWSWGTPKVGLTWSPAATMTWFANVSNTREAPTFDQLIQIRTPPPAPAQMRTVELKPQRSTTYEIGGRGTFGTADQLRWDIALYRMNLRDELIEYSPDGITTLTANYDGKTRHQGVELGISGTLGGLGGEFDGRLAYTYSDFRFRDGAYGGNRIAGVPRNLLAAEVIYRRGALQVGPNVRWVFGDTPVDYENREWYGGYATLGLKLDYQIARDTHLFLQGDNLTDKRYISYATTPRNATGSGVYFYPGNGISVAGGIRFMY